LLLLPLLGNPVRGRSQLLLPRARWGCLLPLLDRPG
jgi:hypothetical protein